MSKKKDPREVKFNKDLRRAESERKQMHRLVSKQDAWQFMHRMVDEMSDLTVKVLKLEHALWVYHSHDGVVDKWFTEFASKLPGVDRQLLVRQYKAMVQYLHILDQRWMRFVAAQRKGEEHAR